MWNDARGAETSVALKDISEASKAQAEAALQSVMQSIEAAFDGSSGDELIVSALNVESADAIRFVDGRPILVGWGAVPVQFNSQAQLVVHHHATLGRWLSATDPPQLALRGIAAARPGSLFFGIRGLVAATLIAALLVVLLPWMLRNLSVAALPRAEPSVDYDAANRALQTQIDTVRRTLAGNVCTASGPPRIEQVTDLLPRSGSGRAGQPANASPRAGTTTAPPIAAPTTPVQPAQVQVPPQALPPGQTSSPQTLADFLKRATVMVVTNDGTGSGFFISPEYVVTNKHVVEGNTSGFMVGSKTLNQMYPAELVGSAAPDFALLKLSSGSSAHFFTIAESLPAQLENVFASGFPAVVLRTDPNYAQLKRGDTRAVPDTALTAGAIVVVQNAENPDSVVVHRAVISPGSSGGPLIDQCGRVVGVNTAGSTDPDAERMFYSLSSPSMLKFLQRFNVSPTVVPGSCSTAVAAATPAPAAQPGGASPPTLPANAAPPAQPPAAGNPPPAATPQPDAPGRT